MECIPLPVIFISNTQNIFNKQKIYFCNSNIHAYDPLRCYIIYIYILYISTHTLKQLQSIIKALKMYCKANAGEIFL